MRNFFASSRRRRFLLHLAAILLTAMLVTMTQWPATTGTEAAIGPVE